MALDDDDKKFIADLIGKSVSTSVAGLVKPDGDLVKALDARAKARLDAFRKEQDKAAEERKAKEKKPDTSDDRKKKVSADGDVNPEVAKLQETVSALETQAREARERAEAEASKRQQERMEQQFRDAAIKAGVPADRVGAMLNHVKGEGRLLFDDNGQPGLRFKRSWGEEVVPLGDEENKALGDLLESPDGKIFLPPANTQGTGEGTGERRDGRRPGQRNPLLNSDNELDTRAASAMIIDKLRRMPGA